MRKSVFLTGALLLAAFLGGAVSQARAHYDPVTPDLDLVPSDCDGFATARVAELVEKLALKKASDLPLLRNLEKQTGVRIADIDRVTLVVCAESQQPVFMVRTVRPCDRSRVLKALAPEAKAVKHRGKVFFVFREGLITGASGITSGPSQAVCFVDDQLIVIGSEENLKQILGNKNERETTGPLAEALARAVTHDVVAWGRVTDAKPDSAKQPTSNVLNSSYKISRAPKKKKTPVTLGTLTVADGVPMPPGATSADLTLDVGKQLALQVSINFADEESAQRGVKYVRVGVEMLRGMMAAMSASMSVLELADELGLEDQELPDVPPVVLGLMKKTEKVLDRVRVEAHGTTIPVSLTIPADAKTISSALVAVMNMTGNDNGPNCCSFDLFGSGNKCVVPPAPFGVIPPPPAPACPPPPMPAQPWSGVPPQMPTPYPYTQAPAPSGTYCVPVQTLNPVPCVEPLPPPRETTTSPATAATWTYNAPPPSRPLKLAIGNVSKEPALLFLETEGGKLTFQKKVPAGEAIDVETTPGQRWVAVFADNPAGETFVVAVTDKPTWLLRSAPREEEGCIQFGSSVNAPR